MSYRCAVCGCAVRAGLTRRTHVLYRQVPVFGGGAGIVIAGQTTRPEIARELPVCGACQIQLEGGTPLAVVARTRRKQLAEQTDRDKVTRVSTPSPVIRAALAATASVAAAPLPEPPPEPEAPLPPMADLGAGSVMALDALPEPPPYEPNPVKRALGRSKGKHKERTNGK